MSKQLEKVSRLKDEFDKICKDIQVDYPINNEVDQDGFSEAQNQRIYDVAQNVESFISNLPEKRLKKELDGKLSNSCTYQSFKEDVDGTSKIYRSTSPGYREFNEVKPLLMNVLNQLSYYYIGDDSTEEVQQFQIEAITINEGVVSSKFLRLLEVRLSEIQLCVKYKICLGGMFLIGSTIEGLLLGVAEKFQFKSSSKAPKTELEKWTLSNLIDVANDLRILKKDRKDFSHRLREYRNYIHPDREIKEDHHPDIQTLKASYEVLKGIVDDLNVHAESVQSVLEEQ